MLSPHQVILELKWCASRCLRPFHNGDRANASIKDPGKRPRKLLLPMVFKHGEVRCSYRGVLMDVDVLFLWRCSYGCGCVGRFS